MYRGCLSLLSWFLSLLLIRCIICKYIYRYYLWRHLHVNDQISAFLQKNENVIVFFFFIFCTRKYRAQVCSSTILTNVFLPITIHIILKSGTWASLHSMFPSRKTIWKHPLWYFATKHQFIKIRQFSWRHC